MQKQTAFDGKARVPTKTNLRTTRKQAQQQIPHNTARSTPPARASLGYLIFFFSPIRECDNGRALVEYGEVR
jgi:hypothetical protein